MTNVKNKNIIITGASGGIGEEIARQIAKNGGNVVLIARSENKLQQLQTELIQAYAITCHYYVVDLTNADAWSEVLQRVVTEINPVHAMINNAGVGIFDLVEESRWQDIERMFQLNVSALIQGVYHLLPSMLEQQFGHIINIGSQAGKIATPKSAVYGATKHAVIGFTNGLRMEVADKGIYVTAVNLGPVATDFFQTADPSGNYQRSVQRYMLDPDYVANSIVRSLFTKKREINLPRWMDIGSRIYQVFPGIMERLLKNQFTKK
ncbi:SDR family NAD(P)-dependent oxidoreductase [Aquibacillus sediminis]|uniref:SDR family NAD(P)-dependent oxidoreductase n=1 Tax=Aquibacillus sediminis TaxID=2574734 RepID=UPI001109265F|nr:SDR family oxidoreductase [Aquibacillus sediminis]